MSLTKTITYNNPANFVSDVGIEITTDAHLLASALSTDGLMTATIRTDQTAEKFQTSGTGTLNGSAALATISGNQYVDCTAAVANTNVSYNAANANFGDTGTIRFKVIPDYNTAPAANRLFFRTDAGGNDIAFYLIHQSSGQMHSRVYLPGGSSFRANDFGVFNLTQNQEYEFEISLDTANGTSELYIDGTLVQSNSWASFSRTGTPTSLIFGGNATISQYWFRDLQVFDVVKHTSAFTGEVPRTLTVADQTTIEAGSVEVDGLSAFSGTESTPAGSATGYILNIAGIDKYWDGANVVTSDGTLAQSNSIADINTNIAAFSALTTAGVAVKVKAILSSTALEVSPTITSIAFDYDFFASQIGPACCVVYGYVQDGCLAPVSGATITVESTKPFFVDGNLYSVNQSVTSNSIGYYEIELPIGDTVTPNIELKVTIRYTDSNSRLQERSFRITVPNSASAEMEDIVV